MRRAGRAALGLAVVVAVASLAWMVFLPAVVERELRSVTGFDVRVAVLGANPFSGRVVVRGLTASNPAAYPKPDFVELRSLQADVSVYSWLFTDRVVVDSLDVDVGKVELVRLRDGRTNAGDFLAALNRGPSPAQSSGPAPKPTLYLVRRLRLRFDTLVVDDYSLPNPDEKAYGLHIDQTFSNLTDPRQLLIPGIVRSLYTVGLRHDASRVLPGEFGKALGDAVGGAASMGAGLKDATARTGDYLKGLLDKLEQKAKP